MKPTDHEPGKYMSITEAAEYLGKSRDWVQLRAKRGLIKTVRHGIRGLYLLRESVEKTKRNL